ncbi:FAD binding domain-containing protein [Geobacter argillaceus]|uniref:4-hydroxybenzoyl-CoA reductase subunit beta n=1 Tax=Geobacter argillaceus TaxID=345631 RepID=A0A562V8E9_9BACT|nr:FAD binding domain-containing protein [Geobacter argillaceus]TWJ14184.1 4-hydroxybenzoyl-CoA reductase subunit beta [Geobacter argillaceus]
MRLKKFEHFEPRMLSEACQLLKDFAGKAAVIAGGTDLVVRMKYGVATPECLINLKKVEGLSSISSVGENLHVGALATLTQVRCSDLVQERYPILAEAALAVGAAQLQNMGTIGGNICLEPRCWYFQQRSSWRQARPNCFKNGGDVCYMAKGSTRCYALYCGDTAAALLALDAKVRLVSLGGERTVPIEEFFVDNGMRHTDLQLGELLAEVILPGPGVGQCGTYLKYRKRGALDFPIVGVAAVITKETAASRLRIAVTGVGSSPALVVPPADFPAETGLTHEMIDRMAEIARKQVKPVSHMEVSPSYRKELVGVLVRDALEKLAGA